MKLFGNKRHADHLAGSAGKGRKKGFILLVISTLILAGSVSALVYAWRTTVKPPDRKEPVISEQGAQESFVPPTVIELETQINKDTGKEVVVEVERPASHKEGFYNILVVGTDDDGTRTDTIMIARMNVEDHSVALLSIPRDTVITGNYAVPKINSVYGGAGKGEKGMTALKTKLAQLLGFEVDGYAMVNLEAFIELVDLVGGVEFDVPMDMHYDDPTQDLYIHLNAGLQHLDGEQAMQLVRFRKGYATQDIQRTQTQQLFLQALAKKCLEEVSLANIGQMAEIFMDNVFTDLSLGNIAYFGQELLKCDFESMYTYTLEGEAVMINDASCYAIYLNKTLEAVNEYFNPYEAQITAANVSIRTPDSIYAEQTAQRAEEEALQDEEEQTEELPTDEETPMDETREDLDGEELTELGEEITENPTDTELPTDDWVVEEPTEEPEEVFWPGR